MRYDQGVNSYRELAKQIRAIQEILPHITHFDEKLNLFLSASPRTTSSQSFVNLSKYGKETSPEIVNNFDDESSGSLQNVESSSDGFDRAQPTADLPGSMKSSDKIRLNEISITHGTLCNIAYVSQK